MKVFKGTCLLVLGFAAGAVTMILWSFTQSHEAAILIRDPNGVHWAAWTARLEPGTSIVITTDADRNPVKMVHYLNGPRDPILRWREFEEVRQYEVNRARKAAREEKRP